MSAAPVFEPGHIELHPSPCRFRCRLHARHPRGSSRSTCAAPWIPWCCYRVRGRGRRWCDAARLVPPPPPPFPSLPSPPPINIAWGVGKHTFKALFEERSHVATVLHTSGKRVGVIFKPLHEQGGRRMAVISPPPQVVEVTLTLPLAKSSRVRSV